MRKRIGVDDTVFKPVFFSIDLLPNRILRGEQKGPVAISNALGVSSVATYRHRLFIFRWAL